MTSSSSVLLEYVCPTLGAIMASVMFAAPVRDLRQALVDGSLGDLNPFPFSFMCGNCLGWTVYGYYKRDPFVVAANLPGLVLSVWLNSGASKLQYLSYVEHKQSRQSQSSHSEQWDASLPLDNVVGDASTDNLWHTDARRALDDSLVTVPQERALLRILTVWTIVIVYVSWFSPSQDPAAIIGVVVNLNLIVFYGAPLQTMHTVLATRNSASIHVPTMIMNWLNTSFWIGYGFAKNDYVIIIPNALGLCLGLAQGLLRVLYPSASSNITSSGVVSDGVRHSIIPTDEPPPDYAPPEEERPDTTTTTTDDETQCTRG